MKKILFLGSIISLLFIQCGKDSKIDSFAITPGAIGNFTKEMKVKQLDSVFSNDSIVKLHGSPNELETQGEVEIFEKGGKKLLYLSPKDDLDPNATINDIVVFDPRYKTEKGLNNENNLKDFIDAYTVERIDRAMNNVLVTFSDTEVYLTIDSKYLTEDAPNISGQELKVEHIQEDAPIKYLRIGW